MLKKLVEQLKDFFKKHLGSKKCKCDCEGCNEDCANCDCKDCKCKDCDC